MKHSTRNSRPKRMRSRDTQHEHLVISDMPQQQPLISLNRYPRLVLPHSPGCASLSVLILAVIATLTVSDKARAQAQFPQAPQAPTVEQARGIEESGSSSQSQNFTGPEFSGTLELELQQSEAQDADGVNERDTGRGELEVTLDVEQELINRSRLVGRLNLSSRRYTRDTLNNDDEAAAYELERLFIDLNANDDLRIRVGRQSLDDPFETVIDEDLDGIRLTYNGSSTRLNVSQTRKDLFEASTREREDMITNTYATLRLKPGKRASWIPYVLHRSAEVFAGEPASEITWYGIQAIVEPEGSAWRYWLHGSAMDGEETNEAGDIELGGEALQFGITWTSGSAWKTSFSFAASQASGGEREERFRQTGLHSNDFALNDKNAFRYLGEVLDPELTNIRVLTLGVGAEIRKNWTTDVAVHTYQQVEPEDNLRGSDIDFDPLGISDQLGTGADLIIGYEPNKQWEIKATAGRFIPGEAFSGGRADAWIARLEIDFDF